MSDEIRQDATKGLLDYRMSELEEKVSRAIDQLTTIGKDVTEVRAHQSSQTQLAAVLTQLRDQKQEDFERRLRAIESRFWMLAGGLVLAGTTITIFGPLIRKTIGIP